MSERKVILALNICTYHRNEYVVKNLQQLMKSKFFDSSDCVFFSHLHIFITDNGAEIEQIDNEFVHIQHNRNTGGAGGFQKGLELIRKSDVAFTHVIFMDDDVEFETESLYILYDFLRNVDEENADRPVAGRMFCLNQPDVQYTAAEIWNGGAIGHVEYMRKIKAEDYIYGKINYNAGADYGGWWFCCFPMSFAGENDIVPFFIHCDDVEYGLRCGRPPIIIEGVQVWHETFEKRLSPLMLYYDTRNPLFVNELHHLGDEPTCVLAEWKEKITKLHVQGDFLSEYYVIRGMGDYLRGIKWLNKIDSESYHKKLGGFKTTRYKNAITWRLVELRFKLKFKLMFWNGKLIDG